MVAGERMSVTLLEIARAQRRVRAVNALRQSRSSAYVLDVLREFEREVADEADVMARESCAILIESADLKGGVCSCIVRMIHDSIKSRAVSEVGPE
jgi:hypothetical protein